MALLSNDSITFAQEFVELSQVIGEGQKMLSSAVQ
jgi:hypothetical protein